jgi:uncharacterized protein
MQETFDSGKRSLLSLICHGCTLFALSTVTVFAPITILFLSDDPIVKANAKESINFHLNIWFWTAVLGVITWLTWAFFGWITLGLGFVLLAILVAFGFLWHFGWSIVAVLKTLANPDEAFRYPFILRLL